MFCRGCLELHLAQEGQQCLHQVGELARAAGDDFLANRAWNCSAGLGPATSPLIDRRYREDIRGARIERRGGGDEGYTPASPTIPEELYGFGRIKTGFFRPFF